jgi:uncharacterized protein (UPF0332 family)
MGEDLGLLNKARENINAAEPLFKEGYIEIASSRAYYAMFYTAEALLSTKGLAFSSHSAVISAFGKEFAKTNLLAQEHHHHLKDAFEIRQVSDYGTEGQLTEHRA